MRDSRNRNTGALVAIDLASDKATVLGGSDKADVVAMLRDPLTGVAEAYSRQLPEEASGRRSERVLKDDIAFLNREARGEWSVTSRSQRQASVDGEGRPRERARRVLPV